MDAEYMTVEQVAELLNVKVATVYGWRRQKHIVSPYKLAGTLRWKRQDILDWIETKREIMAQD